MSRIYSSEKIRLCTCKFQLKFSAIFSPSICTIHILRRSFIRPCPFKRKAFSICYIFIRYINYFHALWNRIGFFHTFCSFIHSNFTDHWNLAIGCPYCDFNLTCSCLACSAKTFCTDSLSFFQNCPCAFCSCSIFHFIIIDSLTVLNRFFN